MEDIAADDDLLGDMLLDSLEFEPPISTNKMNVSYRSPRFDTSAIIELVRRTVVIERDVSKAVESLCSMPVVRKHLQHKTPRQSSAFTSHARRYLEAYLPDSGFEFAVTNRYSRSLAPLASSMADASSVAESSAAGAASSVKTQQKPKGRRSGDGAGPARGNAKADLCVIAVKEFKPGEIVRCKGGVKDLTKAEDEALRNEAAATRGAQPSEGYRGVLGPGRDFSIIKSSMRNCSQLLLGPARFVNHDCEPSVQFYRDGTQMVFKVIRPIGINEEVLVGYGEHYFGWENSECLCATCEKKGRGAFAKEGIDSMKDKEEAMAAAGNGPEDGSTESRRTPLRRKKSNYPSPPAAVEPQTADVEATPEEYANRRGPSGKRLSSIRNSVTPSDREMVDPALAVGPKCQCVTCGSPFFAPETWWLPDECKRCERHYRIYKADWPNRLPTEGEYASLLQKALSRRKSNGTPAAATPSSEPTPSPAPSSGNEAKRKGRPLKKGPLGEPGTSKSDKTVSGTVSPTFSPIRLSPLRNPEDEEAQARPGTVSATASIKKKKAQAAPERGSEDVIELALEGAPMPKGFTSTASDSGSELTEPSSIAGSLLETRPSSPSSSSGSDRPQGPKSLGKDGKTEALAKFWGVEGLEAKRVRKQSKNGPVSVAVKGGHSRKSSGHTRTGSHASRASLLDGTAVDSDDDSIHGLAAASTSAAEQTPTRLLPTLASRVRDSATPTSSGYIRSGSEGVSASAPALSPTPQVAVGADATVSTGPSSPSANAIATQGTERTSVKNLAAFWGAGVEGKGRTRRPVHREPVTVGSPPVSSAPSPPPKRSRQSSESEPDGTPPDGKRARGVASKSRKAEPSSLSDVTYGGETDLDSAAVDAGPVVSEHAAGHSLPEAVGIPKDEAGAKPSRKPSPQEIDVPANALPAHRTVESAPHEASPVAAEQVIHGSDPKWPGVVPSASSPSSGSVASPGAVGVGVDGTGPQFRTIRKNLRIGRPSSISRPLSASYLSPAPNGHQLVPPPSTTATDRQDEQQASRSSFPFPSKGDCAAGAATSHRETSPPLGQPPTQDPNKGLLSSYPIKGEYSDADISMDTSAADGIRNPSADIPHAKHTPLATLTPDQSADLARPKMTSSIGERPTEATSSNKESQGPNGHSRVTVGTSSIGERPTEATSSNKESQGPNGHSRVTVGNAGSMKQE